MGSSKDARSGISTVAGYASHEFRNAERLERRPAYDRADAFHKLREAAQARVEGERLLTPPKELVGDARTRNRPRSHPRGPGPECPLVFPVYPRRSRHDQRGRGRASRSGCHEGWRPVTRPRCGGLRPGEKLNREDAVPPDGGGSHGGDGNARADRGVALLAQLPARRNCPDDQCGRAIVRGLSGGVPDAAQAEIEGPTAGHRPVSAGQRRKGRSGGRCRPRGPGLAESGEGSENER